MSIILPITAIIPAYNRPELVARAVASAFGQRPIAPAEVLVVDDASTDDTAAAARSAGARVIQHERNQGEGGARNTAIANATQPWVALLDSDDEWLPGHLEGLWRRRGNHVLVASSALAVGAQQPPRLLGHPARHPVVITRPRDLIFPGNPIPASGVMARRDTLRELHGFRPLTRGADLDMWIRVLRHGTAIVCPEPGYIYHRHPGQISSDAGAMRSALRELVASYRMEHWWTPSLLGDLDALAAWDDGRAALRDGARRQAARQLVKIARTRSGATEVIRMLLARRNLRRRGEPWIRELGSALTP